MADAISSLLQKNQNEHPFFSPEKCLNRRQRKFTCTLCVDLCPKGVFSLKNGEGLKWDQCIGCGLCTAACPSRCFAPPAGAQRDYLQNMDLSRPVTFSCYREKHLCDKTVECLGGVPWELYAVLAMYTDVVLYIGECPECSAPERAECLQKNMEQLRNFLGDERFAARVHLLQGGEFVSEKPEPEEKKLSRRDIFSGMKKAVAREAYQAAVSRIPVLEDADRDGLQYRRLLSVCVTREREKIKKQNKEKQTVTAGKGEAFTPVRLPDWGMELPAFTANCFGCDICQRICPEQAIENGPEQDGSRVISITPYKCTACGLCMSVCPYGGAAGLRCVQVPYLEKLPLVQVPAADCEICGRPIQPGINQKRCPACRHKRAGTAK